MLQRARALLAEQEKRYESSFYDENGSAQELREYERFVVLRDLLALVLDNPHRQALEDVMHKAEIHSDERAWFQMHHILEVALRDADAQVQAAKKS